jgi:hypothetical protein
MRWGDKTDQITLNFEKRDFLYDNGLVNIFIAFEQDSRFENISENKVHYKNTDIKLKDLKMQITGDYEDIKEIYFILRSIYYSKVFEETSNYKPYYDPENDTVIIGPVLNVKPFLQRSERTKDLLPTIKLDYKKLNELKNEEDILKENYNGKVDKSVLRGKKPIKEKFLPPEKLGNANIYSKPEELGDNITKNIQELIFGEECIFCNCNLTKYENSDGKKKSFVIASNNLVFDFGTGDPKPSFRDSRTKKDLSLCFMCDLIYRYGLMRNYYVDNNVFVISHPSLRILSDYKCSFDIPDKLDVEGNRQTNFLEKGDFITACMNSRLLLLLYKIYNKAISEDIFFLTPIFYFVVTGNGIDDLKVYNKTSYIAEVFNKTSTVKYDSGKPFLHDLMNYAYYKNITAFEPKNIPREKLAHEILNTMPIDSTLFDLSYYNLSLDKSSLLDNNPKRGMPLYSFLEKYLEVTEMIDLKELHENCMLVGDRIGYFAANTNNKTLLYELREIGNLENLTEFFRDLEYTILKEDAGATWNSKPEGKEEKYSDFINKLLLNVQNNKDAALVRNYLGIYAVQKYMSTKHAKNKKGD